MLTGRAKSDFEKWMEDEIIFHPESGFENLADKFQYSLIIDWLDSVGIFVIISHVTGLAKPEWSFDIKDYVNKDCIKKHIGHIYTNREIATIEALKRTNEIYNSL